MDSTEANVVLNEIITTLGEDGTEKPVMEIQDRKQLGYAVCIKTFLGAVRKQTVDAVAAKHKLKVSEESDGLLLC
jgi:hypothetical protein